MDLDLQPTVESYCAAPSPERREAVVRAAIPMVRSLIGRLAVPDHPLASEDDLRSAALVGLLQALDSYDPARGTQFVTLAWRRIQGALVDYLRSIDVLSRRQRQRFGEAQEAAETLRQLLGREPEDQDVADYLGLSLADYHGVLVEAQHRFALSLDTASEDEDAPALHDTLADDDEGFEAVDRRSALDALRRLLPLLPEREQTILGLYYTEGLTLRQIGELLGISDARVSQLMGRSQLRLRRALEFTAA